MARVLTTGKEYGFELICAIVVSKEYAAQNPKVIQGWLRAEAEVHRFIRDNPGKAAEIIFEAWEKKIPIEVIRQDLEGALYPDQILPAHVQILKAGSEFLFRNKMIEVQPDIDSWVDLNFQRSGTR
jgi:ABC-type nitrate/sulfonate/bicarbonate transport system substrate-binding protein